jgi:thiol-disulfide isomerase/thioredoxin
MSVNLGWLAGPGVLRMALTCVAFAPWAWAHAPATVGSDAPPSRADLAHDTAWAIFHEPTPADLEHNPRESFRWTDQKFQRFASAVRTFGETHPDDPRRYNGWVQASFTGPFFLTGFKPEFDERPGWANLITDEAAVLAYRSEQLALLEQVFLADDASTRQRGGAFFAYLVDAGTVARLQGEAFDLRTIRPLVDRVVMKFGDERAVPVVELYAERLRQMSVEEADGLVASLDSNPALAQAMRRVAERRVVEAEQRAADLKARASGLGAIAFTAVDGREVDLTQLRGQVVLVDFWATWCAPCIAELPHLKKMHAEYREHGFEIIGITLENSRLRPDDTDEQAAAKLAAARERLLDFVARNDLPWPQHFDGRHFRNEFALQFGINAIPAIFLFDREGNLAAADIRGEALETEVRRLLDL